MCILQIYEITDKPQIEIVTTVDAKLVQLTGLCLCFLMALLTKIKLEQVVLTVDCYKCSKSL